MKVSVVEVLEGWAALGLPSNDECPLLSLDSLLPEGDAAKRSVSHPSSNGKHSKTRLYLGTAASYAAFSELTPVVYLSLRCPCTLPPSLRPPRLDWGVPPVRAHGPM